MRHPLRIGLPHAHLALTRRGLVLALVGALLGLGLIHDGALAAGHSALEFGRAGALAALLSVMDTRPPFERRGKDDVSGFTARLGSRR